MVWGCSFLFLVIQLIADRLEIKSKFLLTRIRLSFVES